MKTHPSNISTNADALRELFRPHVPTPEQEVAMELLRNNGLNLATIIAQVCPPCADTSAAIRMVREAVMTANAAVMMPQVEHVLGG